MWILGAGLILFVLGFFLSERGKLQAPEESDFFLTTTDVITPLGCLRDIQPSAVTMMGITDVKFGPDLDGRESVHLVISHGDLHEIEEGLESSEKKHECIIPIWSTKC